MQNLAKFKQELLEIIKNPPTSDLGSRFYNYLASLSSLQGGDKWIVNRRYWIYDEQYRQFYLAMYKGTLESTDMRQFHVVIRINKNGGVSNFAEDKDGVGYGISLKNNFTYRLDFKNRPHTLVKLVEELNQRKKL